MEIQIRNAQKTCRIPVRQLKTRTGMILRALGCEDRELSIAIVDDAEMRSLNRQYRNRDRSTDVLSFSQTEDDAGSPDHPLLGDVVLSAETAERQARRHDLSLEQELMLLLIHGVLHLLGYDHERSAEEERIMKDKTRHLFQKLYPGKQTSDACNY